MRMKIVWMLVSYLMALSLVFASCGGEEEEEEEEVTVPTEEEEVIIPTEEEEEKAPPETPEYGGVINIGQGGDPLTFDEFAGGVLAAAYTVLQTNQELLQGDWTKGPTGTGEADWALVAVDKLSLTVGSLAESWEFTELGTAVFHIRQGVHYALNPESEASRLVGGRELTADDIAWSLNQAITRPRSYLAMMETKYAESITAPDKWTLIIKLPDEYFSQTLHFGDFCSVYPPEVTQQYGDMTDWRNSVGTGPFILTDFVSGSSATLVKNPDYWEKDPMGLGKGNQLPYLNGINFLIIPDTSIRIAAFRTGKIDIVNNFYWEDGKVLIGENPQLMYKKFYPCIGGAIGMRTDKPELPFKDKNVRRALMMATDFETIKNTYCGGEAQILTWPVAYSKEYKGLFLPLEEAPESVQELYVYNPDKAKQLLAEAGYPTGFKTKITCLNSPTTVDYISIIKDQWSKVGIEVTIDPREYGAYQSIQMARSHEEMLAAGPGTIAAYHFGQNFYGHGGFNVSYIDDPIVNECVHKMGATRIVNEAEAERLHKELMPYLLDEAYQIPGVTAPQYNLWWPWVKNYNGEYSVGCVNFYGFIKYIWIDQELKTSMGY